MDEDGIDEHSTGIHVLNSVKAAEDSAHGGAADVLLAVVLDDCAARGAAGKNLLVADHSREGGAATDCRARGDAAGEDLLKAAGVDGDAVRRAINVLIGTGSHRVAAACHPGGDEAYGLGKRSAYPGVAVRQELEGIARNR